MELSSSCFVNAELLHKRKTCLFKTNFRALDDKIVHMVMLPKPFQEIGQDPAYQKIYKELGIDGYFKLPPWGVDNQ